MRTVDSAELKFTQRQHYYMDFFAFRIFHFYIHRFESLGMAVDLH